MVFCHQFYRFSHKAGAGALLWGLMWGTNGEGIQLISYLWLSISINEIMDVSHFPDCYLTCPRVLTREPRAEPYKFSVIITVEKGSCGQTKYEKFSYSKEASWEPKFFFLGIRKYRSVILCEIMKGIILFQKTFQCKCL